MWKSLLGERVRLSLQTLYELDEREYIVNGFCQGPGMDRIGTYPSRWT